MCCRACVLSERGPGGSTGSQRREEKWENYRAGHAAGSPELFFVSGYAVFRQELKFTSPPLFFLFGVCLAAAALDSRLGECNSQEAYPDHFLLAAKHVRHICKQLSILQETAQLGFLNGSIESTSQDRGPHDIMITPLASCSLLMLIQGASGWSTTGTTTAIAAINPSSSPSGMLAFFASTIKPRLLANVNQQQAQHHRPALYRRPPPRRAARKAAPRARSVLACMSDAPVGEEQHEGCSTAVRSSSSSSSSSSTNINNLLVGSSLTAAWSAFPAGAWAAAAAAIVGDAGGVEMGARLDAPAAISFGAVMAAFAFLQVFLEAFLLFCFQASRCLQAAEVDRSPPRARDVSN